MNFAVIPTRGRACLADSVSTISPHVDRVFVLFNHVRDDCPAFVFPPNVDVVTLEDNDAPLNLSNLWNLGLDLAQEEAEHAELAVWNVAIINDDAIVQPDWFSRVSYAMRVHGAAAASVRAGVNGQIIHREARGVNLATRLCGWAFMLRGELGLRVNERLHFWFGDDDVDWQSRLNGGTLTLGGPEVPNLYPNGQVTPELQVRIAQDRIEFGEIWGRYPW